MPTITTRANDETLMIERLQTLVEYASGGAIAADQPFVPADNIHELVEQLEITSSALVGLLDGYSEQLEKLAMENVMLKMTVDRVMDMYVSLRDVPYDDDLDHATIDMMEALIASGASETTFDGELSFPQAVVISKEDFKPIVRQALTSWLKLRIK